MDNEITYTYDTKFEGNILVVGRTGCGKTNIGQNLGENKMFSDIKDVLWTWKIALSVEWENNITDCFVNQNVNFEYPTSIEEFDDLLDSCQIKKSDCKKII